MDELEKLYGPVGLGLITLGLPYLLEILKKITKWQDDTMFVASVVITYALVDILYLARMFETTPFPSVSQVLMIILGMILYPLLVWFGTQGIYNRYIQK
jgi:hypothetical protein